MSKGLNDSKKMYELLEGTFMTNPMIDCAYDKDSSTIIVRQYIGPQSRQNIHIAPWNESGFTIVTAPMPKIAVPEDCRVHMDTFLTKCNNKLERGMFIITDDGMILFRTHLSCTSEDDLSLKTVMEEVNLGVRMFMIFMGAIVRAMDGEKYEDIFAEAEKTKNVNDSGELPSEEVYVPAGEEKMSKVTEGMYV
jgi:hypothetical protein